MIVQFYPNPNKKQQPWQGKWSPPWGASVPDAPLVDVVGKELPAKETGYSAYQIAQAVMKHISVAEWVRRDCLIKALAASVPYSKGDVVYPHSKEAYEKLGACRVIGIVDSYKDMTESEWPKNDVPYIVHVFPLKIGQDTVNATPNYFLQQPPSA